jgi:hypothetical protein
MAAAFRSVGVNAAPSPDSDAETLELGGLYSSGEECLPHKVTLGDFLKVCRAPGFDAGKVAFFMPTAHGPCRFGQYAPYLRKTLAELGYGDVPVVSPTSRNGYDGFADHDGAGLGDPDPHCVAKPWRNNEGPDSACGLGFEMAPLLLGIAALRRRRGRC